jgi:hypothetical protein
LPALLFSQVPELMQQYRQRLGGAADELRTIVRHFDADSSRSGYDRGTALLAMEDNPERLIRDQAQRMNENIKRLDRLYEQQAALQAGVSLTSFVAFVLRHDKPLLEKTYETFVPALPLTFNGLMFGVIGWVFSFAVLIGLGSVLRFGVGWAK